MASSSGENLNTYLASGQAIASNTTPQSISTFGSMVDANTYYSFQYWVPFSLGGILSGYKFQFAVPSSNIFTASYTIYNQVTGTLLTSGILTTNIAISGALATVGTHLISIRGLIQTSATPGQFELQMAQNVSNASPITALQGSWATITRIQ